MQQRSITYTVKRVSLRPIFWLGFVFSFLLLGILLYPVGGVVAGLFINILGLTFLGYPVFYYPFSFAIVGLLGGLILSISTAIFNLVCARTGGIKIEVIQEFYQSSTVPRFTPSAAQPSPGPSSKARPVPIPTTPEDSGGNWRENREVDPRLK